MTDEEPETLLVLATAPPSDAPATASPASRSQLLSNLLVDPSQLLTDEVLRRPLEFTQYTSIRYASQLLDAGALASIGSVGDSFDNALAESAIGLYKTECVRHEGPWRGVDDLELGTLSWVHWFNETRLHGSIGHVPPVEFDTEYYRQNNPRQQPLPGELALH